MLTVFPQAPEDAAEENNNSSGSGSSTATFSALLTGDAEDAERRWWAGTSRTCAPTCDVLKLAHHGSRQRDRLRLAGPDPAPARGRQLGRATNSGIPTPRPSRAARPGTPR